MTRSERDTQRSPPQPAAIPVHWTGNGFSHHVTHSNVFLGGLDYAPIAAFSRFTRSTTWVHGTRFAGVGTSACYAISFSANEMAVGCRDSKVLYISGAFFA